MKGWHGWGTTQIDTRLMSNEGAILPGLEAVFTWLVIFLVAAWVNIAMVSLNANGAASQVLLPKDMYSEEGSRFHRSAMMGIPRSRADLSPSTNP
jgi:hypothetical protein